jgi:nicotinamidase-related amidase
MIYCCPICGEWCECDSHGYGGCWFQSDNQAGVADQTIIDEWETIPTPPAPKLKSVAIDPETSALLILDMETTICKNPRCLASISKINKLLTKARREGMLVVYSLTHTGNPVDIVRQIAPTPDDPIVRSNVDKFYKTKLEKILQEHGVTTVLVTGYAANGAVLHTATSAAFRDYHVIIPVDCMSARNPYAEQYTAWHMLNSPGTRNRATLTKVSLVSFSPLKIS